MDTHQDELLTGPAAPAAPRTRRRLVGLLGATLTIALTLGVTAAAASAPSARPGAGATIVVAGERSTAGTPADVEKLDAAFAEYRDCMAEHGIDMPEPVRVEAGADGPRGASIPGTAPAPGVTFVRGFSRVSTSDPAPAFDAGAFEAADEACSPILGAAGIGTFSSSAASGAGGPVFGTNGGGAIGGGVVLGGAVGDARDLAAMVEPMATYAACMRDHSVDVPDPVVDEKAGTFEMRVEVDPTSSDFGTADAACAVAGFSFAVPAAPAGP